MKMLLTLLIGTIAAANPIEGGDPKILKKEWAILRAVIEMRMLDFDQKKEQSLCSASLISKNILLTSRHCTFEDETETKTLDKKSKLILNRDSHFEVIEVVRYGTAYAGPRGRREIQTNTDLALVLVKPTSKKNILDDLPVFPLATVHDAEKLQNEILVAGYGRTNWQDPSAGKLQAGRSKPLFSLEELAQKHSIETTQLNPQYKLGLGEFLISGVRSETILLDGTSRKRLPVNRQGELKSSALQIGAVFDGQPIVLSGDSGSPAIAFDQAGNPLIVGVASQTAPNIGNTQDSIQLVSGQGQVIFEDHLDGNSPDLAKTIWIQGMFSAILASLVETNWIQPNGKIKQPFAIVHQSPRLAAGFYTDTTHSLNESFIKTSLAQLEVIRDQRVTDDKAPQK